MQSRFNSYLSIPSLCDNCCSENIKLVPAPKLKFKNFSQMYVCYDCNASVGCHVNSSLPLGKMADKETRQLRVELHTIFDRLWKSDLLSRDKAYCWLARNLEIETEDCHIAWFSKSQLIEAIDLVAKHIADNLEILKRRREKTNDRNKRQIERTKRKINTRKSNR